MLGQHFRWEKIWRWEVSLQIPVLLLSCRLTYINKDKVKETLFLEFLSICFSSCSLALLPGRCSDRWMLSHVWLLHSWGSLVTKISVFLCFTWCQRLWHLLKKTTSLGALHQSEDHHQNLCIFAKCDSIVLQTKVAQIHVLRLLDRNWRWVRPRVGLGFV